MKKILAVIGARPQFIKHAPIDLAIQGKAKLVTVHTGQHYDENMSAIFFDELGMSKPDYMLDIRSHSHGKQTGRMLEAVEEILQKEQPDLVLVYGDTNSTLAGALAAAKLHIPVAHVEAGLRSHNKAMPEEINRIMTDHVSEVLFAPTDLAVENLKKEGLGERTVRTGDIMYDMMKIAEEKGVVSRQQLGDPYYLATIHRPYNTDDPQRLRKILTALANLDHRVIFPMHPRTKHLTQKNGIDLGTYKNLEVRPAVSYFENLNLMAGATAIITDSGGMQKEAYFLRKQCITVRPETEWVETLTNGWNQLVYKEIAELHTYLGKVPGNYSGNLYGDGASRYAIINKILAL
ncbi:MAG TPA: UDP-N-acetylglucosamine 2-epimerase (non-hydrolyzing) [Saprospiraceae bacterium]|nr:UDP-N-acetylglucosamine 2-epimerase (non-hydrolyzing) [Saprospiraceae bacterium]